MRINIASLFERCAMHISSYSGESIDWMRDDVK